MSVTAETLSHFVADLRRMRDQHVPDFVAQVETALQHLEAQASTQVLDYINRHRSMRQNWTDPGEDQGMSLFHLAFQQAGFEILPESTILEIGSEQTDFCQRLRRADPSLQVLALDYNARAAGDHVLRLKQDVMTAPFLHNSFDWVISLSALEHIGLGHYDQDPLAEDGDVRTMRLVRDWLKPGGHVYFDVPWHPTTYSVQGTSHRIYNPAQLQARMIPEGLTLKWQAFSPSDRYEFTTPPATLPQVNHFWYTALWLQKDS